MKCWFDIECPFGDEDYCKCFSCFLPNEKLIEDAVSKVSVLETDIVYPEKEN